MNRQNCRFRTLGIIACALMLHQEMMLPCAASELLDQAIQEYNAGRYEKVIVLLAKDMKENGSDSKAHYYLGETLKKMGQDEKLADQLEMAAKLVPSETIETVAKKISQGKDPGEAIQAALQPPKDNPFTQFGEGILNAFGGSKLASGAPFGLQLPNAQAINDMVKQTRQWVNTNIKSMKATFSPRHKGAGGRLSNEISMGEMMDLVEDSKSNKKGQSNPEGVVRFQQAPEHIPEWDYWIYRFRKEFNIELFRHLAKAVKNETSGAASAIFSVDKYGHLRGCIYESTADDAVNQALLETIRSMDNWPGLQFPPNTVVTGWNFRYQWNFGRALSYISWAKKRQAQMIAAANEAKLRQLAVDAKIKEKNLPNGRHAGPAGKLPVTHVAAKPLPSVKTAVAGQILPKPKPEELKAQPLKLSDMPPLAKGQPATPEPTVPPEASETQLTDKDIEALPVPDDLFKM